MHVISTSVYFQDGTTPLILASAAGNTGCVSVLLEQGADPNAQRSTGTTSLFFAAQGGYLEIVQKLLKVGAKVDTPSSVRISIQYCFKVSLKFFY